MWKEVFKIKKYTKSIVMVVVTVLVALSAAMTDGISSAEWVNVAIAGVTAAGVFAAPNVPGARYTKSILAVLGAVLTFLTSAIIGGIDFNEVVQIVVIGAGALGVYQFPNTVANVNISDEGSLGVA